MSLCKICNLNFESASYSNHFRTHNITFEDYIILYNYNGIRPTCGCECNTPTKYENGDSKKYVGDYILKIKYPLTDNPIILNEDDKIYDCGNINYEYIC